MSTRFHKRIKFKVQTQQRSQMLEMTRTITQALERERIEDGLLVVYSPHTTAGLTIQENADPDVKSDLLAKLDALVPKSEPYYRHAEGNSDSHLKTVLTGNSVTILIEGGKLMLGRWQGVFLCEFDGPRERELWLKVLHETRGRDGN